MRIRRRLCCRLRRSRVRLLRAGITLERWLQQILHRELGRADTPAPSLQDQLSPEEWVRQFHEWAESHDRTTPLLSDEAIGRESIYPDRI